MCKSQWAFLGAGLVGASVLLLPARGESEVHASLRSGSRVAVDSARRRIDQLVDRQLARKGIEPNRLSSDEVFVRRIYLDIAGRIPSPKETTAFLRSTDRGKRAELIDKLLDSPGYESHFFNFWADILRAKTRATGGYSAQPYLDYIKDSIAADKPYDVWVREMLGAEGSITKKGDGATGYYLRDRGMPLDSMSNTVRIFLGTRLECAQCHNHPFDKWKQKQYFEMAAFTGGMQYYDQEYRQSEQGKKLGQMYREMKKSGATRTQQALNRLVRPLRYGIAGSGTGVIQLPKDYQYDDAKPKQYVRAKTMFGDAAPVTAKLPGEMPKPKQVRGKKRRKAPRYRPHEVGTRKSYAQWLASPKNPRFTTVIVNRLWKRAMGLGLIEPLDNMMDDSPVSNPELIKHLERLMIDLRYDLKAFQRVVFNAKAYQREAHATRPGPGEPYHFPGPLLERMSAEQIWDSMLTLVAPEIDKAMIEYKGMPYYRGRFNYAAMDALRAASPDKLIEIAKQSKKGRLQSMMMSVTGGAMMSPAQRRYKNADAERKQRYKRMQELNKQRKTAFRKRDKARIQQINREMAALQAHLRKSTTVFREYGLRGNMVRAAELPSPAPPGHFLREFGQSDREVIGGAHTDATVPQVLSLINGFVESYILANSRSGVMRTIAAASNPEEKVRAAFLTILSRRPGRDEMALFLPDVRSDEKQGVADMVWTLLNTNEFRFVR